MINLGTPSACIVLPAVRRRSLLSQHDDQLEMNVSIVSVRFNLRHTIPRFALANQVNVRSEWVALPWRQGEVTLSSRGDRTRVPANHSAYPGNYVRISVVNKAGSCVKSTRLAWRFRLPFFFLSFFSLLANPQLSTRMATAQLTQPCAVCSALRAYSCLAAGELCWCSFLLIFAGRLPSSRKERNKYIIYINYKLILLLSSRVLINKIFQEYIKVIIIRILQTYF